MSGLPADLRRALEQTTGAKIASVSPQAGSGTSRQGCAITLEYADMRRLHCFLVYDVARRASPQRIDNFRREAAILNALGGSSVRVPQLIATDEAHLALLSTWVDGAVRLNALDEPAITQVVTDYMRQLALLHQLDTKKFAEIAPAVSIRQRLDDFAAQLAQLPPDPILAAALMWLRHHAFEPAHVILVHGDAGAANFLHDGVGVTALLDWEMTHVGEAEEDFAWIAIRRLFEIFPPVATAILMYENAGGRKLDHNRIRYYHILNQMTVLVSAHAALRGDAAVPGAYGMLLCIDVFHRRILVEALASFENMPLIAPPPLSDNGTIDQRSFTQALALLKDVIVPGSASADIAYAAKGLARLVKYWQSQDRYADHLVFLEQQDIESLMATHFADVDASRAALTQVLLMKTISINDIVPLLYKRIMRETYALSSALGAWATRPFEAF
jgi:aminoglycoside phosphotransferase (APT) family kinase protein